MPPSPPLVRQTIAREATIFALIDCAWLAALGVLFFAYWNDYVVFSQLAGLNVVQQLRDHDPIGGVVPAFVPWAGALGGTTISLIGCVRHGRQWDVRMNIWHAVRPLLGAIAASVGFVILVLVLKTAAGTEFTTDEIPTNPASQGLFFIIAFILGFREGLFLKLVEKISEMILTTGDDDENVAFELNPDAVDFGQQHVGQPTSAVPIEVRLTKPTTGQLVVSSYRIPGSGSPFSASMTAANPDTPRSRTIEVVFTPTDSEPAKGTVEVVVNGMVKSVSLQGTGVS